MTSPDAPHLLASFAPDVTQAAAGDPLARELCRRAGSALADSLLAAARDLRDPVLTATGGLLNSDPVRAALDARVTAAGHDLTAPLGGSLDGALALGSHLLQAGTVPEHPAYLLVG